MPTDAELNALITRDDTPREISPDCNGYVLEVNGIAKGYIKVDATTQKLTFLWTSASEAWPSTFDLVPPGNHPAVNHVEVYQHATFPTTTSSATVDHCQYRIVQGGTDIGYLHRDSNGLVWYATQSAPAGGYFAATAMTFKANNDVGPFTTLKAYDAKL